MRATRLLTAACLALAMAASACGDGGGGGETDGDEKVVKIGFIGPLTGSLGAFGEGMYKSAALAVEQANAANKVPGWKIELTARKDSDDAADAKTGGNAATAMVSDTRVAAVIGTLNSSVAQAVQPILDTASIAMVSPANTNPTLTLGQEWQTKPARPHASYFRVVATDREQGQIAAQYAYDTLKRRRAVVMHDKKTYGQGLSGIFSDAFKKLGGQVADTIEINPGEGDYKAAVTRARGRNPDIIYYGGEFPEAGVVIKNMGELGLKAPEVVLLGGDGIVDKKLIEIGGANATGMYATLVGASASLLPAAKSFVDGYKAKYNAEDYSAFGPPTYDSANIIIEALAKVLADVERVDTATRTAIIEAIAQTKHAGALGETAFDEYGDTTNRLLTINIVEAGDFKALEAKKL